MCFFCEMAKKLQKLWEKLKEKKRKRENRSVQFVVNNVKSYKFVFNKFMHLICCFFRDVWKGKCVHLENVLAFLQEDANRGKPNWEHLSDDLHVLITVEDSENRAKIKLQRAVEEVEKLLVPVSFIFGIIFATFHNAYMR